MTYECNLMFDFIDGPNVHSMKHAHRKGLLVCVDGDSFDETRISETGIGLDEFYGICSAENTEKLVGVLDSITLSSVESITLQQHRVYAVSTASGKIGLFTPTNLSTTAISIDACHTLT